MRDSMISVLLQLLLAATPIALALRGLWPAGAEQPENQIDGVSILSLLRGDREVTGGLPEIWKELSNNNSV